MLARFEKKFYPHHNKYSKQNAFSTDTIQSKPSGKFSREEFSEDHKAEATGKKSVPWGQVGENGVGLSGPNDPAAVLPRFELRSQRNEPKKQEKMVPWGQVGIGLTGGEVSISGPHRLSRPGVESSSGKEPDWELLKKLLNCKHTIDGVLASTCLILIQSSAPVNF